jgi:hypothetical protein
VTSKPYDLFKPGDVVRFKSYNGYYWHVGVVVPEPERPSVIDGLWAHWMSRNGKWFGNRQWCTHTDVELHPDPGPIAASFAYFVMTGQSAVAHRDQPTEGE